jgi:hypothetical protein
MRTPETPDRAVTPRAPGRPGPGGATTNPLGGARHPAAPADPQRPDTQPIPRNPDDHIRGR